MLERSTMGFASKIVTTPLLVALLMVGGPGLGLGAMTANEGEEARAALSVVSDPVGAAVYIDGVSHGVTPLEIDALDVGEHRVTFLKDNYLENSRIVTLKPGQKESVSVELTESAGARYSMQIGTTSGGGGSKLPLILGIAGGGAAAAYFLLRDTNDPPVAGSITTSPGGTGIAALTRFSFNASGASDPDGDPLTFSWDFGDGSSGSGQTTTHTYDTAGAFTVTVTVSDGEESVSTTGNVMVRNMNGRWVSVRGGETRTWTLRQNRTSISGGYTASHRSGGGTVSGSLSQSRNLNVVAKLNCCSPFSFEGTINSDVTSFTGRANGSGFMNTSLTFARQ